jgi:hypothetical protein
MGLYNNEVVKNKATKEGGQLQYNKFLVYDKPYCIWDWDLVQQNIDFIESMRPEYFDNVALHNVKQLEGKEKNLAALSIRLAYFHGMETFFSLICATLQASECVVGWLQKYSANSLRKMVIDINNGQDIMTKKGPHQFSWEYLSNSFNSFELEDKEKEQEIKVRFGKLWKNLATEFVDEKLIAEYNSLKHGLRIEPVGFHLAIGQEKEFGVSPPSDEFIPMGGNEFGSSFFIREDICQEGVPNRRYHFQVKRYNVNWDPAVIGIRVRLLSNSIQNLLSFLKIVNGGKPETAKFSYPSDLSVFEEAWKPVSGVSSMNFGLIINQEDIEIFTKEEILAAYDQTEENEVHEG